ARLPGRSNLSWRWKHVLIRRQRTALGKNREMQVGCIWSWRGTRKCYPVAVATLPRQGSAEPKAGKPVFDGLVPLGCLVRHFPVVPGRQRRRFTRPARLEVVGKPILEALHIIG